MNDQNLIRLVEGQIASRSGLSVSCRSSAFLITLNTITAFEPETPRTEDDELVLADEPDYNTPPIPAPAEYIDSNKLWTGRDGNQWRFNNRTGKWVNVSGPVTRGRTR